MACSFEIWFTILCTSRFPLRTYRLEHRTGKSLENSHEKQRRIQVGATNRQRFIRIYKVVIANFHVLHVYFQRTFPLKVVFDRMLEDF